MVTRRILNLIFIIVLSVGVLIVWKSYQAAGEIVILTDREEYKLGERLRVSIDNNLTNNICFSSCYPYYLEKNDGLKNYLPYSYGVCLINDIADTCVMPGDIKYFEIYLNKEIIKSGLHRLAVPACIGCSFKQNFNKDSWFYSNSFEIK